MSNTRVVRVTMGSHEHSMVSKRSSNKCDNLTKHNSSIQRPDIRNPETDSGVNRAPFSYLTNDSNMNLHTILKHETRWSTSGGAGQAGSILFSRPQPSTLSA